MSDMPESVRERIDAVQTSKEKADRNLRELEEK